jgi:hypothetical protein
MAPKPTQRDHSRSARHGWLFNLFMFVPPQKGAATERYQQRMGKLLLSGSFFPLVLWTGLVYFAAREGLHWGIIRTTGGLCMTTNAGTNKRCTCSISS